MSRQDYSLPLNKVHKFMNKTFRMHNFECARIDKSRQDREGTSASSNVQGKSPDHGERWSCQPLFNIGSAPIFLQFQCLLSFCLYSTVYQTLQMRKGMATCTLLFQEGSRASEHHSALIICFKLSSLLHFSPFFATFL